jgi:membrane-bound ClpP family serine protease
MKLILLIAILGSISAISLLVVIALWRHKKSTVSDMRLINEIARACTALDPEGSVLVHGELWHARSRDGVAIPINAEVKILEADGHVLLVEPCH